MVKLSRQRRAVALAVGHRIGASDVPVHEGLSGKHGMGLPGIVDDGADALRRMAGRFDEPERDAAQLQPVAAAHGRGRVRCLAARAEVDLGVEALAKCEMAGDEITVEVGQHHVLDRGTGLGCIRDVLADVALGVDDDRQAGGLVDEKVGGVR